MAGATNVLIIGSSGAGKSTLARKLSSITGLRHIELDSLYWRANWTPCPRDQYVASADQLTRQPGWIVDGNYKASEDLIWSRADVVIWLNYSFPIVFWRALRRTIVRLVRGERLHGSNREQWRGIFHRDWIPWWVMRNFWRRRREFTDHLKRLGPGIPVFELTRPADVGPLLEYARTVSWRSQSAAPDHWQ